LEYKTAKLIKITGAEVTSHYLEIEVTWT